MRAYIFLVSLCILSPKIFAKESIRYADSLKAGRYKVVSVSPATASCTEGDFGPNVKFSSMTLKEKCLLSLRDDEDKKGEPFRIISSEEPCRWLAGEVHKASLGLCSDLFRVLACSENQIVQSDDSVGCVTGYSGYISEYVVTENKKKVIKVYKPERLGFETKK
jgi:hypothetical protein